MGDLRQVAAGVWVATAGIWASNTVVVVDDEGAALVVDPGITPAEVGALASAITDHGWRVVAGLSTHPHWDHVLWSRALGDVPRFATRRAIEALAQDAERGWVEASSAAPGHERALFGALTPLTAMSPPCSVPGAGAPLPPPAPHDCRTVAHDAHAPGHLALAAHGVLVAGDMLSDAEVPLLDIGPGKDDSRAPQDPVGDYLSALGLLEQTVEACDVGVLVPGHGTVAFGREAIRRRFTADRTYLEMLDRSADPRLEDPWVAGEHAAQVAFVLARRAGA